MFSTTGSSFGARGACWRLWVPEVEMMVAGQRAFSFSFAALVLPLRDSDSLLSYLPSLQASAAAAAPSPVPSSHATTDTELANATPRVDGAVAALLHKSDSPVDSVVDLVGGTPMVRLRKSVPPGGAVVLAKLESLQPNSSVKDR